MITPDPTNDDKGRWVCYQADPGAVREYGKITSVSERFVFVNFGKEGSTSQACNRENLEWSWSNQDVRRK